MLHIRIMVDVNKYTCSCYSYLCLLFIFFHSLSIVIPRVCHFETMCGLFGHDSIRFTSVIKTSVKAPKNQPRHLSGDNVGSVISSVC